MSGWYTRYDGILSDLDGVIYLGPHAVDGAVEAFTTMEGHGLVLGYVTNNASRPPATVAEHLSELGLVTAPRHVVGSAEVTAQLLSDPSSEYFLEPGSVVLVVGTEHLYQQMRGAGFRPVRRMAEAEGRTPAAVVQGHNPHTTWEDLAEAVYALRAGARWWATNPDTTIPRERGVAPGNGAMVTAVRMGLGVPDRHPEVAGKPEPHAFRIAARRLGLANPLVVGDRLDTDILGGNRAGMDTVLVLTGVNTLKDAVEAPPEMKPTYVVENLRELLGERTVPVFHRHDGALG